MAELRARDDRHRLWEIRKPCSGNEDRVREHGLELGVEVVAVEVEDAVSEVEVEVVSVLRQKDDGKTGSTLPCVLSMELGDRSELGREIAT